MFFLQKEPSYSHLPFKMHSVLLWFLDLTFKFILVQFSITALLSCQNINKPVETPSNAFYNAYEHLFKNERLFIVWGDKK